MRLESLEKQGKEGGEEEKRRMGRSKRRHLDSRLS